MDNRNESTHERLNRELARMKFRDVSYWGGWGRLFALFGLMGFLWLNYPTDIRYVRGVAGASQSLASETGPVIQTRVTVDGIVYDLRLTSSLVYPSPGQSLCLRAGVHRFTRHTSYAIASDRFCESPNATPQVE